MPAGLGSFEGFETLTDHVCDNCNATIGREVELPFLRTGFIALMRWSVGVPRDGDTADSSSPFYRGAAGHPPLKNIGTLPGSEHDALFDIERGSINNSPPLKHLLLARVTDETVLVPLPDFIRSADELRSALKKAGAVDARPVRMISGENDPILDIVREVFPDINVTSSFSISLEGGRVDIRTELIMTPVHFRAIAKIGFHYFLKQFEPRFRGNENDFAPIRNFIRYGRGEPDIFVRERLEPMMKNFDGGKQPSRWTHILTATVSPSSIVATCQFFAGPRLLHPGWDVTIGKNPSRLITRPQVRAHAFVYLEAPTPGHDGVMSDLQPVQHVDLP